MLRKKSRKPGSSGEVVLCGLESSYAAEILETVHRLKMSVAAAILLGKSDWSMRGFQTILQSAEVSDLLTRLPAFFALVSPRRRRAAVDWAMIRGFKDFPRLVDPLAHVSPSAYVEEGVSIGGHSIVGAAAELDRFVMVNRQVSIGHHSVLEEFVTVGPGVSIASHCRIERGVMIGTGAVIAPSIVIGADAVIGAGAVVLRPVQAGVTVIGNPARIAKAEIGRSDATEADAGPL